MQPCTVVTPNDVHARTSDVMFLSLRQSAIMKLFLVKPHRRGVYICSKMDACVKEMRVAMNQFRGVNVIVCNFGTHGHTPSLEVYVWTPPVPHGDVAVKTVPVSVGGVWNVLGHDGAAFAHPSPSRCE